MLGALIGAGLGFAGNLLANEQSGDNVDATNQANSLRSDKEYERQKEFAQMGIRWKSDDARAAGLHPLAALGGIGSSYSPTIATHQTPESRSMFEGVDTAGLGNALSGQNTKRAQMATKTEVEKQMEGLALERAQLQNRLLEGQVQNEWAALMGQPRTPSMPSAVGAVDAPVRPIGSIVTKPSERISQSARDSSREAADTPGFKRYQIGHGRVIDLPGQQMSESLESIPGAGMGVTILRAAQNAWNGPDGGPGIPAPEGQYWDWSPLKGTWSLKKHRNKSRSYPTPNISGPNLRRN